MNKIQLPGLFFFFPQPDYLLCMRALMKYPYSIFFSFFFLSFFLFFFYPKRSFFKPKAIRLTAVWLTGSPPHHCAQYWCPFPLQCPSDPGAEHMPCLSFFPSRHVNVCARKARRRTWAIRDKSAPQVYWKRRGSTAASEMAVPLTASGVGLQTFHRQKKE